MLPETFFKQSFFGGTATGGTLGIISGVTVGALKGSVVGSLGGPLGALCGFLAGAVIGVTVGAAVGAAVGGIGWLVIITKIENETRPLENLTQECETLREEVRASATEVSRLWSEIGKQRDESLALIEEKSKQVRQLEDMIARYQRDAMPQQEAILVTQNKLVACQKTIRQLEEEVTTSQRLTTQEQKRFETLHQKYIADQEVFQKEIRAASDFAHSVGKCSETLMLLVQLLVQQSEIKLSQEMRSKIIEQIAALQTSTRIFAARVGTPLEVVTAEEVVQLISDSRKHYQKVLSTTQADKKTVSRLTARLSFFAKKHKHTENQTRQGADSALRLV